MFSLDGFPRCALNGRGSGVRESIRRRIWWIRLGRTLNPFVEVLDVDLKLKKGLNAMDGGGIGSSRGSPSSNGTLFGAAGPDLRKKCAISGMIFWDWFFLIFRMHVKRKRSISLPGSNSSIWICPSSFDHVSASPVLETFRQTGTIFPERNAIEQFMRKNKGMRMPPSRTFSIPLMHSVPLKALAVRRGCFQPWLWECDFPVNFWDFRMDLFPKSSAGISDWIRVIISMTTVPKKHGLLQRGSSKGLRFARCWLLWTRMHLIAAIFLDESGSGIYVTSYSDICGVSVYCLQKAVSSILGFQCIDILRTVVIQSFIAREFLYEICWITDAAVSRNVILFSFLYCKVALHIVL
jgi:hypothetical protein